MGDAGREERDQLQSTLERTQVTWGEGFRQHISLCVQAAFEEQQQRVLSLQEQVPCFWHLAVHLSFPEGCPSGRGSRAHGGSKRCNWTTRNAFQHSRVPSNIFSPSLQRATAAEATRETVDVLETELACCICYEVPPSCRWGASNQCDSDHGLLHDPQLQAFWMLGMSAPSVQHPNPVLYAGLLARSCGRQTKQGLCTPTSSLPLFGVLNITG